MLELRPQCENCGKSLPPRSTEAMICTFECTFCSTCVAEILENVCPNCGGGFVNRPVRPAGLLAKYPATTKTVLKPVDLAQFAVLKEKYKPIPPQNRQ
jgi:uncharacterized protein